MEKSSGVTIVFKTFNLFGDLVLINFLFIICCLPIVTIGPALTALYYSILRFDENEGGITKLFFKGFRTDFRKNLISGLIILVLLLALGAETYLLYATDNLTTLTIAIICIVLFWILGVKAYLFPLNARFDNTFKRSIRNALLLTITNFPRTIIIIFISYIQVVLYLCFEELLGKIFIIFLFLGCSAPAYFNSLIIKKIFKPFLEPAPVAADAEAGDAAFCEPSIEENDAAPEEEA